MTTFTNTQTKPTPGGIKDAFDFLGVTSLFREIGALRQRMAENRAVRTEQAQMARELATYTDAELGELGFSRADLPAIAAGTYRR